MMLIHFKHTSLVGGILIAFGGVFISGLLTWCMYFLIQTGEQQLDHSKTAHMLDFVRIKRDELSKRKERVPEKLPVDKAPPAPDIQPMDNMDSSVEAIPISELDSGHGGSVDINAFKIGTGDGEFLPLVKVVPVYPFRSLNDNIEGNCSVIYTVTTAGATKDIQIIEARCPHKDFRRSSIKAASKFKYKPKIINGEPVEVHNVVNTFIFKINNSEGGAE